ncbi:MAG: hypothetical protein MAG451_03249 [Anaerolineales bacterium]|nr:hypothetical protein [Anaerolineales bacterium]
MWYKPVIEKLQSSSLFSEVNLIGAKVRAFLDESRFLDIHYAPATRSYSYALIDLRLAYPGDKRVFGWDDYPHEGVAAIEQLASYPHHFQRRGEDGSWIFKASPMRGNVEEEIDLVIAAVRDHLQ